MHVVSESQRAAGILVLHGRYCSRHVQTLVLGLAYHDVFGAPAPWDQHRVAAFFGELREGDAALAVRIYAHDLPELDLGRKDRAVVVGFVLGVAGARREVNSERARGVCGVGGGQW